MEDSSFFHAVISNSGTCFWILSLSARLLLSGFNNLFEVIPDSKKIVNYGKNVKDNIPCIFKGVSK